jgi:hypothetical protein
LLGVAALAAACSRDMPLAPSTRAPTETARAAVASTSGNTHFYVSPHQDDWQLFMGDHAAASLSSADKVVFIYTTAGDAGFGPTYWPVRERASKASIDTMIGAGPWTCAQQPVNGHPVQRCTKGKVVVYDMRLPDGNSGDAFGFGYGSMRGLRDQGNALTTVDTSTVYPTWADLIATVQAAIDGEAGGQRAPYVHVNAPEYDWGLTPGDHGDHVFTGEVVLAATSTRSFNRYWFVGYDTQNRPANLSLAAIAVKTKEFAAYDSYMNAAGGGSVINFTTYQTWLARTYFRADTLPLPFPAAPASLSATAAAATLVNLSWTDASTNETGFTVERAPDAGGAPGTFAAVGTDPANATQFTDGGVAPSSRYWYRVQAFNADGTSSYSNVVSAVTPAPPPPPIPAAPSTLTAVAAAGRVDLAWKDNAGNEGGFRVERAPDVAGIPGIFVQVGSTAANVVAYSDAAVAAGVRYWYRVRAFNAGGSSAYSAVASATTPSVPLSNLTGTISGGARNATVALTWTRGSAGTVDVWRNLVRIRTGAANTGSLSDHIGAVNTPYIYVYTVCETNTLKCTNLLIAAFW